MKKILGILLLTLMVSGCGKLSEEEAKKAVLDSLENAYTTTYMADGVGLAVYADQKVEYKDEGIWYKVAGDYKNVNELIDIAKSAYKGDLLDDYKEKIKRKYKDIDSAIYTKSEGGSCLLPYFLDEAREEIEKITTITEIKSNKITIKVNNKEYTLTKKSGKFVSDEKIFICE